MKELARISRDERMDELEAVMLENFPTVECPITDHLIKGFYAREMAAPAGTVITSQIHKTEHFFILLEGEIEIWLDNGEKQELKSPYIGTTKEGTRRAARTLTDVRWVTFHNRLENETVEQIGERILEPHFNKKVGGYIQQNEVVQNIDN